MNSTVTPDCPCAHCGYMTDRASAVSGDFTPVPDDISLCFRCGGINLFAGDLTLRKPSADELAEIDEATMTQIEAVQRGMSL